MKEVNQNFYSQSTNEDEVTEDVDTTCPGYRGVHGRTESKRWTLKVTMSPQVSRVCVPNCGCPR